MIPKNSPILRSIGFSEGKCEAMVIGDEEHGNIQKGKEKIPPVLLNGDHLRLQLEPILWISPLAALRK